jgi:AraC-like DNA-binding protein
MMAETFTTSGVPAPQQFDAWVNWFDGVYDVTPRDPPRGGFRAQSQSRRIGGCMLSRTLAPAIRVVRTMTHVRRNPVDHWVITLSLHTKSSISSGNTAFSVPARTPFVLSLADALTSDRAVDERLQLYLSRDRFADLAPALDRVCGTALDSALGRLLGDYLVLLDQALPDVAPEDLPRLNEAIGAMVAACLAPAQDRGGPAGSQIDLVRLEQLRRIVRRHLRSPALGPRLLCHRLAMSRSKLFRLMEAEGGVARYIQRQRLLEAYALLSNPSNDQPITVLAEELCFADTSGFSRAFRRQFHTTPSDARAASRTAAGPGAPPADATNATSGNLRGLLRAF